MENLLAHSCRRTASCRLVYDLRIGGSLWRGSPKQYHGWLQLVSQCEQGAEIGVRRNDNPIFSCRLIEYRLVRGSGKPTNPQIDPVVTCACEFDSGCRR